MRRYLFILIMKCMRLYEKCQKNERCINKTRKAYEECLKLEKVYLVYRLNKKYEQALKNAHKKLKKSRYEQLRDAKISKMKAKFVRIMKRIRKKDNKLKKAKLKFSQETNKIR